MTLETPRVVLYARVSGETQAKARTVQEQQYQGQIWAKTNAVEIQAEFLDDAQSGMLPFDERPGGKKLLAAAGAGKFDTVLVYALDRMGRDAYLIARACHQLKEHNVTVKSMTETFDDTPAGHFMRSVFAGAADYAHKQQLKRLRDGRRRAARESRVSGGIRPYGYTIDASGKRLIPDDSPIPGLSISPADVVRLLFSWLARDRLSLRRIAGKLNDLGIPTHSGRRLKSSGKWQPSTLYHMATNPTYKGTREYDRPHELITYEVPALVDSDTWQAAQQTMHDNQAFAARNTKHTYLLRGLLKCGLCGRAYAGMLKYARTYRYPYYRCSGNVSLWRTANLPVEKCPSGVIAAHWLEDQVWEQVIAAYADADEAARRMREKYLESDIRVQDLEAEIASHEKDIERRANQRKQAFTLFLEGAMRREDLDEQIKRLDRQTEAAVSAIAELRARIDRVQDYEASIARVEQITTDVQMILAGDVTDEQRVSLFRRLIDRVEVWTVGIHPDRTIHINIIWRD